MSTVFKRWLFVGALVTILGTAATLPADAGFCGKACTQHAYSWPVDSRDISFNFHEDSYPFEAFVGEHSGIDIATEVGTPVTAPAKGRVIQINKPAEGKTAYVMLQHKRGVSTLYLHLSKVSVKRGERVKRGEVIGLSGGQVGAPGSGALSTGEHLHFEVRKRAIPVNPLGFLKKN